MFLVVLISFFAFASAQNQQQCRNIQIDTDKVQGQCCIYSKNPQERVDIRQHLHEYFARDGPPPFPHRHHGPPTPGQRRPLGPGDDSINKNNQEKSTTLLPESITVTSQVPENRDNQESSTYVITDDRIAIDVPENGCVASDQVRDPSGRCVSKF